LTDHTFQENRSDAELLHVLSAGKDGHMPSFDQLLSDHERLAVVSYVRSLDDPSPP
jgi:mono/diheme cytochrome c family protein